MGKVAQQSHSSLEDENAFRAYLAPLRKSEWVVYAKRPFAGPAQVLAYLAATPTAVPSATVDCSTSTTIMSAFAGRITVRTAARGPRSCGSIWVSSCAGPDGFHRIRHYGLFANGHRADKLALCRALLGAPAAATDCKDDDHDGNVDDEIPPCPCCGGHFSREPLIAVRDVDQGSASSMPGKALAIWSTMNGTPRQ
jgi:hypothetical protein